MSGRKVASGGQVKASLCGGCLQEHCTRLRKHEANVRMRICMIMCTAKWLFSRFSAVRSGLSYSEEVSASEKLLQRTLKTKCTQDARTCSLVKLQVSLQRDQKASLIHKQEFQQYGKPFQFCREAKSHSNSVPILVVHFTVILKVKYCYDFNMNFRSTSR